MSKFWCRHRWSTVKRWQYGNDYFAIQRCRRCERWIRRRIQLLGGKLEMLAEQYIDLDVGYKSPELINPIELVHDNPTTPPTSNPPA